MHERLSFMAEKSLSHACCADRRGSTIVEFAIGLPILITLVFGGLEVANLALAQQRVTAISSQVASNAARGVSQIDETDVRQIFVAAKLVQDTTPILENGRVILSSVRLNAAANGQWIEWQRCTGSDKSIVSAYGKEGKGKSDTSLQSVGSPGIKAPAGADIMLVEIQTKYQPLFGSAFAAVVGGRKLRAVSAHVVRDRTTFAIKNDSNLPASSLQTC